MKKLLLSIIALACGMSMNAQTTGTATRTGNVDVKWVQLWADGPKFAEYNVGAANNKAEDYGGYYCWGSSIDKDPDAAYNSGTEVLTGDDDTATKLWGSAWRMPTEAEFQALFANCDVTWTAVNGMSGCKFTGKGDYKDNSVFLPAAGNCNYGDVSSQGDFGFYWSTTPDGNYYAYYLFIFSGAQDVYNISRNFGCSVRAVLAIVPDTPTAIEGIADNAISTQRGGKKIIQGGKLTIIGNNGKMYNTVGIEIKK